MSIGDEIRKARIACGLTQRELAQAVGVSHGLVGQWENDGKKPGRDNLLAVAQATLVSMEKLSGQREDGRASVQISDPLEIEMVRSFRRMSLSQKKNMVQLLGVSGDVAREMQKQRSPSQVE